MRFKPVPELQPGHFYLINTDSDIYPAQIEDIEEIYIRLAIPSMGDIYTTLVTKNQFARAYIIELLKEQVQFSFPEFYRGVMDGTENIDSSQMLTDEQSTVGNG